MSADVFVSEARKLIGARWRHLGRHPWAVDCLGLIVVAGKAAGLTPIGIPRVYGREPWDDGLRAGLIENFGRSLKKDQASVGDIALLRWGKAEPSHVGIIGRGSYGELTLIHAHNINGVIEQSLRGAVLEAVIEVYRPWGSV